MNAQEMMQSAINILIAAKEIGVKVVKKLLIGWERLSKMALEFGLKSQQ